MLDVKAREPLQWILVPVARGFARMGFAPWVLTAAGFVGMIVGAVFIARGHLLTGVLLSGAGAILDVIDGTLARETGTESARGALLDTVTDRLGEIALFCGIGFYMSENGQPRAAALIVLGIGFSLVIPFIRARAEAAGAEGKGGLMGRAERLILVLLALALEGLDVQPFDLFLGIDLGIFEFSLWVLVVMTGLTILQRFRNTWVQLGE